MSPRRKTRQVAVGRVRVGGDAPVALQSMTSTYTYDIDATLAQIHKLAAAGADFVRVAVPDKRDTEALQRIVPASPVPIVADVHFHFERALEAIAAGVHKIRLNPGNIQDRAKVRRVIAACKERGIPIRVGANEGGIVERRDKGQRAAEQAELDKDYAAGLIRIMLDKLDEYLRVFDAEGFHDVVISAKSPDPRIVIDAYTAISQRYDYPLHLGVTHAGPPETGRIRSIAALSSLLANGIGDTIRISYAADPVYEVEDGKELLCSLGLRARTEPELIACPTCGRIEVDLFTLVQDVRAKLAAEITLPMKVAVMGCVVNGPGECEGADVAIFAGKGRGIIYVQGEQKQTVTEDRMLEALLAECRELEARVQRGEAKLIGARVEVAPPEAPARKDGSVPLKVLRR
ncbi:MAG TPA: flavodoxin-dependent (E)-4-hydroxy-3-methylbut-2-enyl-diphosphate synthase [Phycisphaerae bacterium]|nr:flavodoxin-dependent (E)-4-hydroxy-3-methylbut-2-enyl-diphosphate synthase [Phycisphaerae bacterium]HQL53108.1 flavodoxin-dependent (E)-4-hydroxy-3-methylbut-2-enyl-diphosphate synthase [Phycisphaerae bacterium]